MRMSELFMTFLDVLSGQDLVTLIAFGLHSAMYAFRKQDYLNNEKIRIAVQKTLSRTEVGLNTLVGVRMLEKCTSDFYIMITDFHRDRAPQMETQLDITRMGFSPGVLSGRAFRELCFTENGPHERIIRDAFNIANPVFFNMTLDASETILIPSPPNGGSYTIDLPQGQIIGLTVSYMLRNGEEKHVDCELQDDETIPYKSSFMKPCSMVE